MLRSNATGLVQRRTDATKAAAAAAHSKNKSDEETSEDER